MNKNAAKAINLLRKEVKRSSKSFDPTLNKLHLELEDLKIILLKLHYKYSMMLVYLIVFEKDGIFKDYITFDEKQRVRLESEKMIKDEVDWIY